MKSRSALAHRARVVLDVLVTTAVGIAAVVLIWRTWMGPPRPEPPRQSAPGFEDIASSGLTTSVEDAPTLGSSIAPVVLIEYSDFECPFCAQYASEMFGRIEEEFVATERVEYVFRNYPIDQIHPSAIKAAQAAACAHRQGSFREMRTLLIANYRALADLDWDRTASSAGLDTVAFDVCLRAADVVGIHREKESRAAWSIIDTDVFHRHA